MSGKKELKQFPIHLTDEDAEHFVDTADLSEYDFSGFKPMHFEFQVKSANINMRVPQQLLDDVRAVAKQAGMPYQRFIRQTLEQVIAARKR